MSVVSKLTAKIVRETPFAAGSSYYVMEGRGRRSLRGFGIRVYRTKKEFVVRYRGKPYSIGRTDLIPLPVAREEARKLLLALLRGEEIRFSRKTMEDLRSDYLRRHAKPHKAPRSAKEDARMWRLYVLPVLGADRLVHEVTPGEVQDLHVGMASTPFAANRVLALLSKAFNLAELWGWRERGTNPTRGIQRYPEPARKRHLSSDEFRRLGRAIAEARHEQSLSEAALTAIELLIYTGCRPGEVLGLKWACIDLEAAQIRLPKAKADRPGRRARGRVIWLNEAAKEVLARIERQPDNPHVLVGSQPGQHLKEIGRAWSCLCRTAGIQGATLYTLRHSFVSEGVLAGVPLEVVADLAGHSDVETTDRVYRARRDDVQRAGSEALGKHLRELTNGASGSSRS